MVSLQIFVQEARKSVSLLERRDQMLAALTLPLFIVAAMGLSVAFHKVILESLPDPAANIGAIVFLSGFILVLATMAACFFWVRTGGFGIFAD